MEFCNWFYVSNIFKVLKIGKSVEQGAATTVWAATAKCLEGKGGLYLEDCGVGKKVKEGWTVIDPGWVERTFDEESARRLWDVSSELVGVEK